MTIERRIDRGSESEGASEREARARVRGANEWREGSRRESERRERKEEEERRRGGEGVEGEGWEGKKRRDRRKGRRRRGESHGARRVALNVAIFKFHTCIPKSSFVTHLITYTHTIVGINQQTHNRN